MAKSKTPAKRARRAEENRLRNNMQKSRLKTAIRKYLNSIKDNNVENANKELLLVTSLIDKSVNKGILHRNTADRKKSKLTKQFNSINQ
ncbi:MAG: 30S ribosomal protein S20 [Syntrophomonadaceae bacterium]|nr:30S ribosomal protein S20 [Syntrophomonadaceae bacterium]